MKSFFVVILLLFSAQTFAQQKIISETIDENNTELSLHGNLITSKGKVSQFDERWQKGGIYEGFRPEQEIIEKRSRNTKHFRNSDGTITAQIGPLTHYTDQNGNWNDVNYDITSNSSGRNPSYAYCNITNEIKSYFPLKSGDQNITMDVDQNNKFSWWHNPTVSIKNNGNLANWYKPFISEAIVDKQKITYPNVYDGISEEFVVVENGIENNTIINYPSPQIFNSNPGSEIVFSQFIPIYEGWKVFCNEEEKNNDFICDKFSLKIPGSEKYICFQPVVIFDNKLTKQETIDLLVSPYEKLNNDQKDKILTHISKSDYQVHFVQGGIEISISLTSDWVNSPHREFPVTIDPTVEVLTGYTQSSSTNSGMPYNTFYHDQRYDFLLLASDLTNVGITTGSTITAMGLYCSANAGMAISNFTIRSQFTSAITYSSWLTSGWTVNYGPSAITTPISGSWYDYTLSTPIVTNTNNLAINISRDNTSYVSGGGNYVRGSISGRAGYGYSDSGYSWPYDGMSFNAYDQLPCLRITYSAPSSPCNGDVYIGSGSSTTNLYPVYSYYNYSRSMSIINRSEMSCTPGLITHLAVYVGTAGSHNFTGIEIRLSKTTATTVSTTWDGSGTLVWSGNYTFSSTGWVWFDITDFNWDSDNLLISWQHGFTSYTSNYPYFAYTTMASNVQNYAYSDASLPTTMTTSTNRTNYGLRFLSCTPPTISSQPSNSSYCIGGSTNFTCVGGPTPSYQWQYYSGTWNNVANGTPAGAVYTNPTSSTMTVSGIATVGSYDYRCIVSNGCSPAATSNMATLSVNNSSSAPTSISATANPVCPSSSSTLSVVGGTLGSGASWQWYSGSCGGTAVGSGASISVSPAAATTYYVRAEGLCNTTACATSLTINMKTLSTDPTGSSASVNPICAGNSSQLSVSGGSLGTGASWKWYSGSCGGTLVGTGSPITVSPGSTTSYYVRAEGDCNTSNCSPVLALNVNSLSVAPTTISASSNPICPGNSTTLNVVDGSLGSGASWKWYTGGCGTTLIGTGSSIVVSPGAATTYYVRAEGTCNTTSCASITINLYSQSTAPTGASANPTSIANGGSSTLSATGGSLGTGANWTWHTGGCAGAIVGTGNPITVYPSSTTTYYVNAIGTCNTTTCATVTVTVSSGQIGVINNGAVIYFKGSAAANAYMYIDGGTNGNFYNYANGGNNGRIYTENNGSNGAYIKIEGSWYNYVNNGVFQQNGAPTTYDYNTTEFLGLNAQSIAGDYQTNFYNLTTSGTNTVTMNVNAQAGGITNLTGVFALNGGPFNINSYLITITNPATTAVTRTTGYLQSTSLDQAFNSRIQWNIGTTSGAHVFPFGTGSSYIPFTFNLAAGATCGNLTLSTYPTGGAVANTVYNNRPTIVTNLNGINTGTTPPANAANIVRRFWSISPATNPLTGGSATLTFTYDIDANEAPLNGEDINNMVAQRYNVPTNTWQPPLSGQTSNTTTNVVTVPGVTQMSPWTISRMTQPLPVEMNDITATCTEEKVFIIWSTLSENNCERFEIERSEDLFYWDLISSISGHGYSNDINFYQSVDQFPSGNLNYYRIKQIDGDGNYTYYGPVSTNCMNNLSQDDFQIISISSNNANTININYRSPVAGSNITITVYNTIGQKLIYSKTSSLSGNNIYSVSSDVLSSGIYYITITCGSVTETSKVLIQQ